MTTLTRETTLVTVTCPNCHMVYAIPDSLNREAREENAAAMGGDTHSKTVTCPAGHGWHYTGLNAEQDAKRRAKEAEAVAAKARQAAERLSQELAQANTRALRAQQEADHERRVAAARKGQLTKLRRRLANGVCPCCNRQFPNVLAHMSDKHPDFALPQEIANA